MIKSFISIVVVALAQAAFASEAAKSNYIPVEGMENSLYIWAHPAKNAENQFEVVIYSERELDNAWLQVGDQSKHVSSHGLTGTLHTYKLPGTISLSEVEELSLSTYDVASKSVVQAKFEAGSEAEDKKLGYALTNYAYSQASDRHTGLVPLFTETAKGSNKYHVDLITLLPLESVQMKVNGAWTVKASAMRNFTKLDRVYRLPNTYSKEEGLTIEVRAKKSDRSAFTQKFSVVKSDEGLTFKSGKLAEFSAAEVAKYEAHEAAVRQAEMRKKIFGGPYRAQEVAEARANYMASLGIATSFHINWNGGTTSMLNGMIPTLDGPMWEGTGWATDGVANGTCSNGKQLIAEAVAHGSGGTYRVRFFRP